MPETSRTAASAIKYRKAAYVAAAIGTAVAIAICVFLGVGQTEFQSQAVLSYSSDPSFGPGGSTLSAETVAAKALDDAHLNTILDGFGLYPEMRQGSLQTAALIRFRSNIAVTQSSANKQGEVDVHLSFRDFSPLKSPSVANALADVLATYAPSRSSAILPAPAPDDDSLAAAPVVATGTDNASTASTASNPPVAPNAVAAPPVAPKVDNGNLSGLTKDQLKRKMNWIDGQLADLATEQSTLHAASLTLQGRISQLQMAGHEEAAAPHETPRSVVDPNAPTRAQLSQQLAAEQQKLVALRERYTDAYPDVQTTQANVTNLQAKLADLPPPPRPQSITRHAPDLYQSNVDQMTAEESKLGEKLRDVEHGIAGLEHYRDRVRNALQSAPDATAASPQAAPQPVAKPVIPPPPPAPVKPVARHRSSHSSPPPSAADLDTSAVRPFRLVTSASTSIPIKRLSPTRLASVAGGWLVFLLLCLVPLRWTESAVISSESDVRATLPGDIAYLGNIRRIVQ